MCDFNTLSDEEKQLHHTKLLACANNFGRKNFFLHLLKARQNESKQENLLSKKEKKNYKKILNVVRTLQPIVFHVKPADKEDGSRFFFQAFDVIDQNTTKLNPVFDALFFCSVDTVKKVLNYTPKA